MTDAPRTDSRAPGDDDQHWLDLMAGRAVDDVQASTRREAAWLRAALLSYRAQAPEGAPSAAGPRADRLVARARAAGVLPMQATAQGQGDGQAPTARVQQRGRWIPSRPALAWALAASLAGLMLFGTLRWTGLPGLPDPQGASGDAVGQDDTLRGASQQQRRSSRPLDDRDQLLQQLRAAGFDARPYERLGRPAIDVDLPVPLAAAQRQALTRLKIAAPQGPGLQIEFVADNDSTAAPR